MGRARNDRTERALAAIEAEPYTGDPYAGSELISSGLRLPDNPADFNSWNEMANVSQELWSAARRALLYWSPERVEKAAFARAANDAPPSTVSREVQVLTALQQGMIETLGSSAHVTTATTDKFKTELYLRAFADCLLALERRAATVEGRAFDFRLRIEFEETRRVLENSDAASALADMIKAQAAGQDPGVLGQELREIRVRLTPIETRLLKIERDTIFIADRMTNSLVKSMLPLEQLKATAGRVAEGLVQAGLAESAKAVLEALAHLP